MGADSMSFHERLKDVKTPDLIPTWQVSQRYSLYYISIATP